MQPTAITWGVGTAGAPGTVALVEPTDRVEIEHYFWSGSGTVMQPVALVDRGVRLASEPFYTGSSFGSDYRTSYFFTTPMLELGAPNGLNVVARRGVARWIRVWFSS